MKYEVRYIIENEEHSQIVEVDNAADAVESISQEHSNPGDNFELIQVQLLEDPSEADEVETLSEA